MRFVIGAGLLGLFLAAGCAKSVEESSVRPVDADAAWSEEFARAERLERGALFDAAEKRYLRALRLCEAFDAEDPREARTRMALADLYIVVGRTADAESQYREVIRLQRRVFGEANEAVADSQNRLGVLYADTGRPE